MNIDIGSFNIFAGHNYCFDSNIIHNKDYDLAVVYSFSCPLVMVARLNRFMPVTGVC